MNKPKELTGEVKKFEDLDITMFMKERNNTREAELCGSMRFSSWNHNQVKLFYTQPFKPEMIEEYFEGILKSYDNFCFPDGNSVDCEDYEEFGMIIIDMDNSGMPFHNIKTLSDFIDACINSDIKLRWK